MFEKTNPMLIWAIWHNISNSNGLWSFCGFQRFWAAKNKANSMKGKSKKVKTGFSASQCEAQKKPGKSPGFGLLIYVVC